MSLFVHIGCNYSEKRKLFYVFHPVIVFSIQLLINSIGGDLVLTKAGYLHFIFNA